MKPIFKSKTAALALLTALVGFWEPSREWVAANPAATMSLLAVANLVLRMATKDKVTLFNPPANENIESA